jgi:hypothetical protein
LETGKIARFRTKRKPPWAFGTLSSVFIEEAALGRGLLIGQSIDDSILSALRVSNV